MRLSERLLAIHEGLSAAELEHAFGGAIALAYWTLEPRGTRDIDVNVFVAIDQLTRVLNALPADVKHDPPAIEALTRDGQARLWWDETPIDLFLSYLPLHDQAASNSRVVPFEGEEIPVLGPLELAIFKAMFDRTKDWADIEAMLVAQTLDLDAANELLISLIGSDDERIARLSEAARRASRDD